VSDTTAKPKIPQAKGDIGGACNAIIDMRYVVLRRDTRCVSINSI
jgi:hypothetical protein